MKILVLAAIATLALASAVDARPRSQMADLSHVVKAAHASLPTVCGYDTAGNQDGAYWLGCVNLEKRQIGIYFSLRHDQFAEIYGQLQTALNAGRPMVIRSRKHTVFFDGPKGIAQFCEGAPNQGAPACAK